MVLPCPRRLQALAFALACALSAPTWAQSAKPTASTSNAKLDEETEQKVHDFTKAGIAHARRGDLEAARQSFAEAWALKPDSNLAVLLARIEMKLGRYRDAAEHWEFYLRSVPPDVETATEKLAECRQHLGSVRVSGEPAGAFVYVNGRELGPTPLSEGVWLDPGEHTFIARLGDRTSPEQKVKLAAGETRTLTLVLSPPQEARSATPATEPAPAPAPHHATMPPDQRDAEASPARTIVLVTGGVLTAGALVTGIVSTLRANSLGNEIEDLQRRLDAKTDPAAGSGPCAPSNESLPPECEELLATGEEHDTARNVAIASYISAGALAIGTTVTYLVWPKGPVKSARNGGIELGPLAGARGIQLRMRF